MAKMRWILCHYCEQPIAFGDTWDHLYCDKECLAAKVKAEDTDG